MFFYGLKYILIVSNMEDCCYFVSSRGLLKSCDVYNSIVGSSDIHLDLDKYLNIQENQVVYVCNSAVEHFFKNIFPFIKYKFILVSGDSDVSMPFEGFEEYINDDKLIVWFSQNLVKSHDKLKHLPIGIDYHTLSKVGTIHPWGAGMLPVEQELLLNSIKYDPIETRFFGCYVNFHFPHWDINKRGDRQECLNSIDKSLCYFEPEYVDRYSTWNKMKMFKFVLCPYGGGVDTHRLWEALILGCIPVIKSCGLDPLFEDLNVCIVDSWSDVNADYLNKFLEKKQFHDNTKLTLDYWVKKIQSYKI